MAILLLVEDDPMNLDLLRRYLRLGGHDVLTATNGAIAVEEARSKLPDLVLMDMGLPVLNGWEATLQIKAAPETCHIPVIALTAYAMAEERQKCLAVGCDDYETKPVEFSRLLDKIKRLLDRASAAE